MRPVENIFHLLSTWQIPTLATRLITQLSLTNRILRELSRQR